jgi:CRISPR-associated protein Csm3
MNKWKQVVKLTFKIKLAEGTRIGGSGGGLDIGEVVEPNLTAIRNPANGEFYIPGSSLKGKLRCVLERELGKSEGGSPCTCGQADCLICTVFGAHLKAKPECAPTRIVVRDAPMSAESRERFHKDQLAGRPTVEEKTENIINRASGAAEHPRTGERVLPGASFDGQILLHIYEGDDEKKLADFVRHGLGVIQEASSIGASGSRGYGRVSFENVEPEILNVGDLRV